MMLIKYFIIFAIWKFCHWKLCLINYFSECPQNFSEQPFYRTLPNNCFFSWRQIRTETFVQRCSVKKSIHKNFPKFTGKHLCQSLFFCRPEACNCIKKEILAQMFLWVLQNFQGYPLQNELILIEVMTLKLNWKFPVNFTCRLFSLNLLHWVWQYQY